MLDIAILIPCYNEALTIEQVISDCKKVTEGRNAQIFVYDNNSTDGTNEIAKRAGAVVRYEHKQGKGNVIRRMFRDIDSLCYIMIDGDNTYDTSKIPDMADMVLNNNMDMVIGDRLSSTYFTENKRPFHNIGNILVRKTVNVIFDCKIKDIMTGLRALSYNFVNFSSVIRRI